MIHKRSSLFTTLPLSLQPFLSLHLSLPPSLPPCSGPEDIHGGNLKLILDLIWTLIGKYQIKSSGRGLSTKKAMMGWIATVVPEYHISNFKMDWNDGRVLCGMVDCIRPGLSPNHYDLDKTHGLDNCRLGMDLAEQHLDIPKVLSPEDLNNPEVDDLSVMTYLSYFCNPANAQLLQWIRKKIPQQNIKNLKTDWNTGINLAALTKACFPGVCPDWDKMEPANGLQNNEKMIALIKERLGLECMVSAAEISDPKVDEIVVATYLSQLRNAKLRASPEEFSLSIAPLPGGCTIIQEPVTFEVKVTEQAAKLASHIHINTDGPSSDVAVSIKPKKDSPNLVATFIPMEAGSYDILASYNGQNIQGSPLELMVADPSKCLFLGDPPSTLQVGQTEEVIVKTQGAGEGKMACTIEAAGQSATPVLSSSLKDQGSNTYGITLNPKSIGEAMISVTWAGHPIPRSPFHVTICDASKCSMEGLEDAELVVGKPVTFTVSSAGAGDGKFEVKPQGPSALYSPSVTDKGNEKQEVSFTPWEVGAHEVEVLWGGAQIPKSPVSLSVRAAPDVTACSATGQGLKNGILGKPNALKILSPEKDLLSKPDGLAITVTSVNEEAPVEIKDNGDATYTVMYTPPAPGAYVASIKFFGKPIPGSPFKIEVIPAPDASKCRAYGPALHPNPLHIAGTPLDIFVDTKTAGTGVLQVAVKGPDNSPLKVFQANDSGLHSLKFDVPTAGHYYIHVSWSRAQIPGSPFKIEVHPGPIAGNMVAYGPGLEPTVKVGDKGEFTIETKNAGIGTLIIRVHGVKKTFKIKASPESKSNRYTLKAHFDPKKGGDYIIAIRWSGIHIPNSPFNIHILDEEEEGRRRKKRRRRRTRRRRGKRRKRRGRRRRRVGEEEKEEEQEEEFIVGAVRERVDASQ